MSWTSTGATTTQSVTISGTISDPGGTGVEGAEVSAWTPDGTGASVALTDSHGRYQLTTESGAIHMHVAAPVASRLA